MLKFIKDFKLQVRGLKADCMLLVGSTLLLCVGLSFSQTPLSPPVIKKVTVEVEGQPDGEEMARLIPLKEGESFSLNRITESIKKLYKTGLFSDIQVAKEGKREVHLIFRLTKRFFTRKIYFLSKERISQNKLKQELDSVREGIPFSEKKLSRAVEELEDILEEEGYFNPRVRSYAEKDFKTSSVNVFFEIDRLKRFEVKKIEISGPSILPESELKKAIKTKEGNLFVPSVLEKDVVRIKDMYRSLEYPRAEVNIKSLDFDQKEERVSVVLEVAPHQRTEIVVRGADVPSGLLGPIWEERIFEEWGLAEGKAKIINYLREKGFLFTNVRAHMERRENAIRVVYMVSPGKKYTIEDLSFQGMKYFTPSRMKRELGIKEKIPLVGWISGRRLFELPRDIEALYERHGFSEARVDLNFIREDKKVQALFYIQEGPQKKIESISFQGLRLFKPEKLRGQIQSFSKGPFFRPNIQKDVERLEGFYLDQGVRGTEIEAEVKERGENLYSVVFNIQEGERVRIEEIIITGNIVTKRGIILRELRIKEGDYARYESIRETKTRLEKLGIFTEVDIEEIQMSPGRENLIVNVREGAQNYIGLGVGVETKNEPQTFAVWNNVIRPRATAEFIRGNMFGQAIQLSVVGQFSLKEKRGVISWEQPYFFGLPWQTYLNAWLEREERKSFSFDRRGISLTAIKSISEDKTFLGTLRWARTTLFNLQIAESEIDRKYFPFSASSVSGSFIWEGRDDPFNPEKGFFFSFVLEWAYPFFTSESDFLKNFIKYQNFLPVLPGVTFSSTFRLGLGEGKMPIHERFFGGGSNSFRGEEFDELGPKDPDSQNPIGGKALLLLNFELTFPLLSTFPDLSGAVFYDKGNVFANRKQLSVASLQDALGVGLRYRTPLGPIRLELGWNMDAPEGEKKVLAFITIGNVF
ncbi:MAG: POTRA domain-containing protein [Candidatus Aminicenantes bacterium]